MFKYPFSLISGQGLGISYSSLNQIGDILPSRPCGQSGVRVYANVANGNVVVTDHVYRVIEANGPLEFYFVYNFQATSASTTWRFAAEGRKFAKLSPTERTAVLVEVDGHETVYTFNDTLQAFLPPGLKDGIPYLKYNSSQKQWVHYHPVTQITELYNEKGFLLSRSDAFNRMTKFEYDHNGNVSAVICPSTNRYIIQRKDQRLYFSVFSEGTEKLLHTYELDQYNRVVRSTTSDNYEVEYSYAGDTTQLRHITQSDGTDQAIFYTYVGPNHVIDRVTSGTYATRFTFENGVTTASDPNRVMTKIYFDQQAHVVRIDRQNGYTSANGMSYLPPIWI